MGEVINEAVELIGPKLKVAPGWSGIFQNQECAASEWAMTTVPATKRNLAVLLRTVVVMKACIRIAPITVKKIRESTKNLDGTRSAQLTKGMRRSEMMSVTIPNENNASNNIGRSSNRNFNR